MCAQRPFGWSALLDLIVVPRAGGPLSNSEFRLPEASDLCCALPTTAMNSWLPLVGLNNWTIE